MTWKGYPGYGPNRCTKMKVFRPKNYFYLKATEDEGFLSSFERKWRFIRQCKVSPMDLAICWDMIPEDPQNEPKRPTHIDGSNGCAAPAIFSLVRSPKNELEAHLKCDGIHGCDPLFHQSVKQFVNKEFFFHRSKNASFESKVSNGHSTDQRAKSAYDRNTDKNISKSVQDEKRRKSAHPSQTINSRKAVTSDNIYHLDKNSNKSTDSRSDCKNISKSAFNLNEIKKISGTKEGNKSILNNLHYSTPNLSEQEKSVHETSCKDLGRLTSSLCVACKLRNMSLTEKRSKAEYKMAFKAGVPQKNVSRCYKYVLKVPKQKTPYKFRNYAIDSLAPPFSLQKAKREEYPEHWRLATVYQHSYKPMYARKRSFLQTVFK